MVRDPEPHDPMRGDAARDWGRVVLEVVPGARIGFDSAKMRAAAPSAAPSGR